MVLSFSWRNLFGKRVPPHLLQKLSIEGIWVKSDDRQTADLKRMKCPKTLLKFLGKVIGKPFSQKGFP